VEDEMPFRDSKVDKSAHETQAEEALRAAERSQAREAGSARWLVGRLGLCLVALGAQLVRLGLPAYRPMER
jgi:hypothetical protein